MKIFDKIFGTSRRSRLSTMADATEENVSRAADDLSAATSNVVIATGERQLATANLRAVIARTVEQLQEARQHEVTHSRTR